MLRKIKYFVSKKVNFVLRVLYLYQGTKCMDTNQYNNYNTNE